MENCVKMRPLTDSQYAKSHFRTAMAELSYPEKVRQLVALQERIVPVCAARGQVVVPWVLDDDEGGDL